MTVGRNDPCPCGSGKKYKQCCMPQNQVISLSEARFNRAYRRLLADLAAFAQEALEDEPWAYDQFYGTDSPAEPESVSFELLDWAAFNYRDWEGETLVAEFAGLSADELDDTERAMIQAWKSTHMGLYRVLADEGLQIHLQDWLTGAQYHVVVDSAEDPMAVGDLIICRLLPVGDSYRFGYGVLSRSVEGLPPIGPVLEQELVRMRRQKPGATWEDLLTERWPLVREILNAAEDELPPLTAPAGPASLGLTEAPAGAPELQRQVARQLSEYLEDEEIRVPDREAAMRLWWDAASVLNPTAGKPEIWSAAAAYAFLHTVLLDDTTQAQVAQAFGVSASILSSKYRAISEALRLEELDDRYADPLDPRVRVKAQLEQASAVVAAAEQDAVSLQASQLLREGADLLNTGKYAEAEAKFTKAIAAAPWAPEPRVGLSLVFFVQGDYRGALAQVKPQLVKHPDHVTLLSMAALCQARLGQRKEAESYASKAKQSYLRYYATTPMLREPSALQRLVDALASVGDDKGILAVVALHEPKEMDPHTLRRAGVAAARTRKPAEAVEWLSLAQERGQNLYLVEPFLAALQLMQEKRIPAFALDYEEDYLPKEIPTSTAAVTKAILVHAIFYTQEQAAKDAVRMLSSMQDPWAAKCLRELLSQPHELPTPVWTEVVREMVRRGEVDPATISSRNIAFKIAAGAAPASLESERRTDAKKRKDLAAPLGPTDSLETLLDARSKGDLDTTAAGVGITQTYRYKKADLARAIANQLPSVSPALVAGLPEDDRQFVARLLAKGPVPFDDTLPFRAAWRAGLVHFGTPAGATEPVLFLPEALKPYLL